MSGSHSPLMMADPVWAYRKNYEPKEVLFEAIRRMHRYLASLPEEATTLDELRTAFNHLWRILEEAEMVVVTAHTAALMSEEQWLLCQQQAIAQRRSTAA